ncbi:MAG: SDR family oxidoreductase [Myxococcales bacterium]|nr:SDR family oxidoreductase [Myxococcales bacterium]MCB9733947.1 SDR family oxidoreductase [Deltaproteobacteria bacterium]
MDLAGKNVIITGGSAGLGRALAFALARRGARLALVARGRAALDATVAALRAEGAVAHAFPADVGDKDAVYALTGAIGAVLGDVDAVVHDASTLGPTPLRVLGDTACEDLERVLAVNVVGPFRLTKALIGPMLVRGAGLVVHVSSDAAVEAYPGWGPYGASKAALDHLSRIWAAELDGTGVRFLGVDPGEMDTAMHAAAIPDADPATLARPADVAEAVARLMEDAAIPSGARVAASLGGAS